MNPQKAKAEAGESKADHPGRWEHFHHQADVGIRGFGPTPQAAFEQAARALTAVISELEDVHPDQEVAISCEAPDLELLLVDWLNALVYEMATRQWLFSRFEVELSDASHLTARAWGEPVDRARHQPAVEVKAATYAELSVKKQQADEWVAQCVVDV